MVTSRGLLGFWAAAAAACNPSLIIGRSGYSLPILTENQSSENSLSLLTRVQFSPYFDQSSVLSLFWPRDRVQKIILSLFWPEPEFRKLSLGIIGSWFRYFLLILPEIMGKLGLCSAAQIRIFSSCVFCCLNMAKFSINLNGRLVRE